MDLTIDEPQPAEEIEITGDGGIPDNDGFIANEEGVVALDEPPPEDHYDEDFAEPELEPAADLVAGDSEEVAAIDGPQEEATIDGGEEQQANEGLDKLIFFILCKIRISKKTLKTLHSIADEEDPLSFRANTRSTIA